MSLKRHRFRVISASQMGEAELSFRKWYFNKILRLPTKRKAYFGFGIVLAAVLERYMNAGPDDRLPDGSVVDLYPESYEVHEFGRPTGRFERWDAQLQKPETEGPLIKELVAEAIEKGYLRRSSDRWVEWALPNVVFVEDVKLMGFGDLAYPADAEVLDHKSTKSFRYMLSKNKMKDNIQLILYAKVMLERSRAEKKPDPPQMTLGHIYYLKDGGVPYGERVKMKTVRVTPEHVDARFDEIMAHAKQMHTYSQVEPEHWQKVPCSGEECARAYGGCPFLTICGGEETVESYVKRLDTLDAMRRLQPSTPKPEETNMAGKPSLIDRMKSGEFRNPEAGQPPAAPAAAPASVSPPWAQENCPSCRGSGWNPQGEPCNICVGLSKFDLTTVTLKGPKQWEPGNVAAETCDAHEKPQEPAQEPQAAEPPAAPKPASAPSRPTLDSLLGPSNPDGSPAEEDLPAPKPKQDGARAEPPAAQSDPGSPAPPAEEPKQRGRGRPKGARNKATGFTLCIGCVVTGPKALNLADVLEQAGADLAKATAAEGGYFTMGPWDRRDMLAARIDNIIEAYIPNGSFVYVSARHPDLDALAAALTSKAAHVINAIG